MNKNLNNNPVNIHEKGKKYLKFLCVLDGG